VTALGPGTSDAPISITSADAKASNQRKCDLLNMASPHIGEVRNLTSAELAKFRRGLSRFKFRPRNTAASMLGWAARYLLDWPVSRRCISEACKVAHVGSRRSARNFCHHATHGELPRLPPTRHASALVGKSGGPCANLCLSSILQMKLRTIFRRHRNFIGHLQLVRGLLHGRNGR
jgi:hypothetical protein